MADLAGELITEGRPIHVLINNAALFTALFFVLNIYSSMRGDYNLINIATRIGLGIFPLMFFIYTLSNLQKFSYASDRIGIIILSALPIYTAVNFFSIPFLNSTSPLYTSLSSSNVNGLLATFGIITPRLGETITLKGSNTIGMIASISIISLVYILQRATKARIFYTILTIAAVVTLVWNESRFLMVITPAIAGAMIFLQVNTIKWIGRISLLFAALSAPIISALFSLLSLTPLGDLLTRQGGDHARALGVGTGRSSLWELAFDTLREREVIHLIGFGYPGHVNSGLVYGLSAVTGDMNRVTFHNAFLQYVFDQGYIGGFVFFVVTWLAIGRMASSKNIEPHLAKAILGIIIFVIVAGYLEVSGAPYNVEVYLLFVITLAFSVFARTTRSHSDDLTPVAHPAIARVSG